MVSCNMSRLGSERKEGEYDDKDPYGHPRVPFRGHYDVQRCDKRREWAEMFASCTLKHTGQWWLNEGEDDSCSCLKLKGNIENPIGLAKIPVGLVGPLLLRGEHVKGYALCPFATTEGALVASATRGATALTRAGGVSVKVAEQCLIRAPAFQLRNMEEVELLWKWILANKSAIQKQVHLFSQHADLIALCPVRLGRMLTVIFKFTTQDAAGQNMTTSGTWHCCKWILRNVEKELPSVQVTNFWVESNLSGDKKIAAMNLFQTRGIHAQAEAWIPEAILKSVLKVDSKTLLQLYHLFRSSSVHSGCVGFNVNVSNIIAAVFLATGQDVGCVGESASAQFILTPASKQEIAAHGKLTGTSATQKLIELELQNDDDSGHGEESNSEYSYGGVYASMVLPSLVLGTVGGGTSLATQRECLSLMGCYGKGGVYRLAEMIAGFALGLDLSTLSAIASGQFATAHERLGRNRPTHGLKDTHLDLAFFSAVLGPRGELLSWNRFNVITGNSILSELTKAEMSKKVGHFGFKLTYKDTGGSTQTLPVVLKSKPTDVETSNMVNKMAQGCGLNLAALYERNKMEMGFRHCNTREVILAEMENPELKAFMPHIYHTIHMPSKDVYVVVMEHLTSDHFMLLNTADDVSGWTIGDIKVVLRDLAKVHSLFLGRDEWLRSQPWLEPRTGDRTSRLAPLWKALLKHAHAEFPEFWTRERVDLMISAIDSIPQTWSVVEAAPQTMIHNDCNPRNICLRKPEGSHVTYSNRSSVAAKSSFTPYTDPRTMCMYDWELATITVPQHDLAEFLAFVLQPATPTHTRLELIDFYRQHLQYYSGMEFPLERFVEVFNMASLDFAMNRLLMYTMAHTYKDYLFLPRVVSSHLTYLMDQAAQGAFQEVFTTLKSKL